MFENLSERLGGVFDRLTKQGALSEADVATALRELSLLKGHFRYAQTGILDAFLETYRDEGEAKGKAFLDWVREDYDPAKLQASFKPKRISSLIADRLLARE